MEYVKDSTKDEKLVVQNKILVTLNMLASHRLELERIIKQSTKDLELMDSEGSKLIWSRIDFANQTLNKIKEQDKQLRQQYDEIESIYDAVSNKISSISRIYSTENSLKTIQKAVDFMESSEKLLIDNEYAIKTLSLTYSNYYAELSAIKEVLALGA